jgi:hypothetical protein
VTLQARRFEADPTGSARRDLQEVLEAKDVELALQQEEISELRARLDALETVVAELAGAQDGGAR